ncbi:MAG: glycosyltransferase family 2 protein [Chloroflexi bacterium]|nr:glycosyltransferase family 2 protein [Chloroflexota bacterium]
MDTEIQVSVIIPAYNEEAAIVQVVRGVIDVMQPLGIPYEILVVDDGSTDGTGVQCQACPQVRVLRHHANRGTGAARTTGVLAAQGEILVMIDADGTYPVEAIPQMLQEMERCDMVIGARKQERGTLRLLRSAAKEFIKALASYLTRTPIPDLNSGLRAMRRSKVLEFLPILPETHSWVSTITMAFLSSHYSVCWIPIEYYQRIGRSTFHPITDTYNYLTLVVRAIMYFNPLRVFLPLTLFLFTLGVFKMIFDIFRFGNFHFPASTVMLVLTSVQVGAIGLLADLIVRRSKL